MSNKNGFVKKIIVMLVFLIILFVPTVVGAEFDDIRFRSNRFTQMNPTQIELVNYNDRAAGFTLAAQTDYLVLYVNQQSLAIKVRNLITGYVWSSTQDVMEDHQLNNTWRHFVDSAVTIDFIIGDGNVTRESLTLNYSMVDFQLIESGFLADIVFGSSGIELQLVVTIENNDIVVKVPNASIYEPEDVQLITLQLYPFLGATKEDYVPGYMFIPDGAGALIRFDQQRVLMDTPWRAMIYGFDYGVTSGISSTLNDPFMVTMPIYGMVHGIGQNALLTIVESGDFYGEIIAHTAGLITEFNWVTTLFHYRQFYTQPTTRDANRGPVIQLLQTERNHFDIVMRHLILSETDADYVGMARSFQQRLVEQGVLAPITEPAPMIHLEFFGAEMRESLLWNTVISMTPVAEIQTMIARLQEQGMSEMLAVYWGWVRGGASNSYPQRSNFERRLGSRNDLQVTIDMLESAGIPLYFHTNFTNAHRGVGRLFGGPRLAEQLNSQPHPQNFLVPQDSLQQASHDLQNFASYGIERLALQSTATHVYSTHNNVGAASRSANRNIVHELLELLNAEEQSQLAIYNPIAPFWGHTNSYFLTPMTSSGYLFTTDTIPFLQIVLRGHINYYTPFMNFEANSRQAILQAIDFGAYPAFLLTAKPSHLLADTPSRNIFTSEFDVWEQTVVETYQIIQATLGQVRGQAIIAREVLAPGVTKTTYANGVVIIVNYTSTNFRFGNITIYAEDFHVKGGGAQ